MRNPIAASDRSRSLDIVESAFSQIGGALFLLAFLAVGAWCLHYFFARARDVGAGDRMAEEAFERQLVNSARTGPSGRDPFAAGPGGQAAARRMEAAEVRPESAGPFAAPRASAATPAGGDAELPLLAGWAVAKFRAGGLLESVEGPLRSDDPDLLGTVVVLRGGERIAILEDPLRRDRPAAELALRRYDGAVVPGPGRDPVFVRRFESFVADRISL